MSSHVSIDKLVVGSDLSIRKAMQRLDATAEKCLFVIDVQGKLIGALTDGDVRRAILAGQSLDDTIDEIYNRHPVTVHESPNADSEAMTAMKKHVVEVVPVLDTDRHPMRYITWQDQIGDVPSTASALNDTPVVIMAGGLGTRLEPFTHVLPKPLIPVHDKTIVEHIVDRFVATGANQFWLTVNYKSRIMKAFFHDLEPDYSVEFIDEPTPLGTAGSLRYLDGAAESSFFVTNCDIIVNTDYAAVLEFHRSNGHMITVVGSTVHYQIPYGTCVLNGDGSLSRIDEKPEYDFLVNTGMYVVEPSVVDMIPADTKYHFTDLIHDVIESGQKVGVFPVSEDAWIDVGQWTEFSKAADRLRG